MTTRRQRIDLKTPDGLRQFSIVQKNNVTEFITETPFELRNPFMSLQSGGTYVSNLAHKVLTNTSNLFMETSKMSEQDAEITESIGNMETARQSQITSEVAQRELKDSEIESSMNVMVDARTSKDLVFESSISLMGTQRAAGDVVLAQQLSSAKTARADADSMEKVLSATRDSELAAQISSLNTELDAVDTSLREALEVENARLDIILNSSTNELNSFKELADSFESADAVLQEEIDELSSAISRMENLIENTLTNDGELVHPNQDVIDFIVTGIGEDEPYDDSEWTGDTQQYGLAFLWQTGSQMTNYSGVGTEAGVAHVNLYWMHRKFTRYLEAYPESRYKSVLEKLITISGLYDPDVDTTEVYSGPLGELTFQNESQYLEPEAPYGYLFWYNLERGYILNNPTSTHLALLSPV